MLLDFYTFMVNIGTLLIMLGVISCFLAIPFSVNDEDNLVCRVRSGEILIVAGTFIIITRMCLGNCEGLYFFITSVILVISVFHILDIYGKSKKSAKR